MEIGGSTSGALFSDGNRKFRYALWRIWDRIEGTLLFVGLNPSTANELKDDPTIRRMIGFAKAFGFGGLYVANLFSIVSADPRVLFFESSTEQPGGPNDRAIQEMRKLASTVVVGWGEWGQNAGKRPSAVLALLGEPVFCLKVNRSGEPCHPLYLPKDTKLVRYSRDKNG
jgi:hypothetical protein